MTKSEILRGLQAGKVLRIDRRDSPALPAALELESEGLAVQRFKVVDDQYSYIEFRLAPKEKTDD